MVKTTRDDEADTALLDNGEAQQQSDRKVEHLDVRRGNKRQTMMVWVLLILYVPLAVFSAWQFAQAQGKSCAHPDLIPCEL